MESRAGAADVVWIWRVGPRLFQAHRVQPADLQNRSALWVNESSPATGL